jgi:hypothetical protein
VFGTLDGAACHIGDEAADTGVGSGCSAKEKTSSSARFDVVEDTALEEQHEQRKMVSR